MKNFNKHYFVINGKSFDLELNSKSKFFGARAYVDEIWRESKLLPNLTCGMLNIRGLNNDYQIVIDYESEFVEVVSFGHKGFLKNIDFDISSLLYAKL